MKNRLLSVGITGTVITALCCFTPILVVIFAALGLSAWLGWLDYVLLPILVVCVGMIAFALWRKGRA